MTFLLNVLWFICGGFVCGCAWILAGVLMAMTIIGLPFAFAAWRIAGFAFFPFGKRIVDTPGNLITLPLGCLGNLLWLVLGGWYIALAHVTVAIAEAVTIIGIPFAFKDIQFAQLALMPLGKDVVPTE